MKYLLILLSLFIVGCGHTPEKEVIPFYLFADVVCERFGHIDSINSLPVIWVIGTDAQGNKVLGLRGDAYSNLSINSGETIRYIKEQTKAIEYYEKCIADHNATQNEEGGP